jgi:hypothetical protein
MEKISKNPRGRPRLIHSKELRDVIRFAANPGTCERTLQNKLYQLRAMQVLNLDVDDPPLAYLWIWGLPHIPNPGDHRAKWTILAELGRIEDDDDLRAIAAQVCELKLKTSDAVAAIRRVRLGKAAKSDVPALTNALIRTINQYLVRCPDTTGAQIVTALENVRYLVVENDSAAA